MKISKESIILIASTILIILVTILPLVSDAKMYFLNYWAYLFAIPLAILYSFGDCPSLFGYKLGKWPFRIDLTVAGAFLIIAMVYIWSLMPEFREYYLARIPRNDFYFLVIVLGSYYFAEEFFFRGFLLFSLTERFGSFAIAIQAVPFALFHLGKPPLEILLSLFAGLIFGYIAYRTRSFFYPFLIHWGMGIALMLFISLA